MPTPPLTTLGPYALEAELGRGGMGIVYRAIDTRLGRPVALKVVHRNVADAIGLSVEELRARLRHEAQLAARILHPNVVTVFAYDEVDDDAIVAMELVHGPTLADLHAQGRRFTPVDAAALLAQAADGVAAAHALGIVHRDLKPANLMLAPDGRCKVLDFGIAKATSADATPSVSRVTFGTVQYMAPEQVLGRPVSPATDVWALGVILYELISGTSAFGDGAAVTIGMRVAGEEPPYLADAALAAQLFGPVTDVLRYALRKRAEERFPDAAALAGALRASVGLPQVTHRSGYWGAIADAPRGAHVSPASGPVSWTPVSGPVGGTSTASGPVSAPSPSGPIAGVPVGSGAPDRIAAAITGPRVETPAFLTDPMNPIVVIGDTTNTAHPRRRNMTTAFAATVLTGLLATAAYLWSGRQLTTTGGGFTGGGSAAGSAGDSLLAEAARTPDSSQDTRAGSASSRSTSTVPPSDNGVSRRPDTRVAEVPPRQESRSNGASVAPPAAELAPTPPAATLPPANSLPSNTAPAASVAAPSPAPIVLPRLRPARTYMSLTQGDTTSVALQEPDVGAGNRIEWRRESGNSIVHLGNARFTAREVGESRFVPVVVAPSGESLAGEPVTFMVAPRARAEQIAPPAAATTTAAPAVAAVKLEEINTVMAEAARRAPDQSGKQWEGLGGFAMPPELTDQKYRTVRTPKLMATRIVGASSSGTRFESTFRVESATSVGTTRKTELILIGEAIPRSGGGVQVVIRAYRVNDAK